MVFAGEAVRGTEIWTIRQVYTGIIYVRGIGSFLPPAMKE
jgi:hypothetical protein